MNDTKKKVTTGPIGGIIVVALMVLGLTAVAVLSVRALGHAPTIIQDVLMTLNLGLVFLLTLRHKDGN